MRFSFPLLPLPAGDPLSPVPFVLGGIGLAALILLAVLLALEQRKKRRKPPQPPQQPPQSADPPSATSRKQAIFENAAPVCFICGPGRFCVRGTPRLRLAGKPIRGPLRHSGKPAVCRASSASRRPSSQRVGLPYLARRFQPPPLDKLFPTQ